MNPLSRVIITLSQERQSHFNVMVKELRSLGLNLQFKEHIKNEKKLESAVGENE